MAIIGELAVAITGDTSALQAATRKGSEEMRQFARDTLQSKRVIESLERPTETYARKLAELNRLHESGALDTANYQKAVRKLQEDLRKTEQSLEDVGGEAEKTNKSFGGSALGNLRGYVTALGAIGGAAGLLKGQLEAVRQEAERGISGIGSVAEGDKRLAQIGQLTPEVIGRIDAIAGRTDVSRAAARETFFSLFSATGGQVGNFESVIRAQQLLGPQVAVAAGSFARNFADLSGVQSASALLAASQASDVDFEQLTKDAFKAGQGGRAIGATAAGTLASLASLSNVTGDPATAARLLRSFGLKAQGAGLSGEFVDVVNQLQSDAELRGDFIKDNQELQQVFNALSDSAVAQETRRVTGVVGRDIRAGGTLLENRLGQLESNVDFIARRESESAESAREANAAARGRRAMRFRAARERAAIERLPVSFDAPLGLGRVEDLGFESGVFMRMMRNALTTGSFDSDQASEDTLRAIQEQTGAIREQTDVIRNNQEGEVVSFR